MVISKSNALRWRPVVIGIVFVVALATWLGFGNTTKAKTPTSTSLRSDKASPQSSGQSAAKKARTANSSALGKGNTSLASSHLAFPLPTAKHEKAGPNLAPGSNPAVLPSDVLIADEGNDRLELVSPTGQIVWQFPRPGDLAPGQTFLEPDDAFFTSNGKDIVATEENNQVISLISISQHKILWRYGEPGTPGPGVNQLDNPDDAMMMPNGDIITADIKNCSILVLKPPFQAPIQRFGENSTACDHQPPMRFGSPNGAFPLTDGNYLISEINGDWADEMTLGGKILWSTHPPGVAYPSDTNEIAPNRYLTVDYSSPGQIVEFNSAGKLLWRYGPASGPGMLSTPSLCEPIPTNGDILCNDDANDRVIVIDPHTNRIVWQYGHDGTIGRTAGYLNGPDGVDLAPPYSVLVRHRETMGSATPACARGLPTGACATFRSK